MFSFCRMQAHCQTIMMWEDVWEGSHASGHLEVEQVQLGQLDLFLWSWRCFASNPRCFFLFWIEEWEVKYLQDCSTSMMWEGVARGLHFLLLQSSKEREFKRSKTQRTFLSLRESTSRGSSMWERSELDEITINAQEEDTWTFIVAKERPELFSLSVRWCKGRCG